MLVGQSPLVSVATKMIITGFSFLGLWHRSFRNDIGLCVCQRTEATIMQGCDKDASGNSDTLRNIIMFILQTLAITLSKDDNQPGGCCDSVLVGVCSYRFQRGQPFITNNASIKFTRSSVSAASPNFLFHYCIFIATKCQGC